MKESVPFFMGIFCSQHPACIGSCQPAIWIKVICFQRLISPVNSQHGPGIVRWRRLRPHTGGGGSIRYEIRYEQPLRSAQCALTQIPMQVTLHIYRKARRMASGASHRLNDTELLKVLSKEPVSNLAGPISYTPPMPPPQEIRPN